MVVTFTKAAAQEMSARIGLALAKAMESTEDAATQERLERQLNLLPSAHISTLHLLLPMGDSVLLLQARY